MKKQFVLMALVFMFIVSASTAWATMFTASSGSLSASADFELVKAGSGYDLVITLTNTSTADVMVPADVLTAVFFTIEGDPQLKPYKASLNKNSTVYFGKDDNGSVGGEWAYANGLKGAPLGADEGISSSGLDLFGPKNNFPGINLQGPADVDGLQYGLTSLKDDPKTGNKPVIGENALIHNSVVFLLGELPKKFDLSEITDVSFQYGTKLCEEPNLHGHRVPEPSSLLLLGSGLLGIGILGRKKFSK
jgi:hypothetical protein